MNVPQVVYFILLPGAQARPFIHLEKSCLSSSHAHLKYLLKYYVPDDAMEAWGKILHSYFQIILRLEPLCLGTHHWWVVGHIHSLILAFRAHIPLISIPVTGHRIGSMASQHVCPAPPSQEVWFFFSWSSHTHWCLIISTSFTMVRLEVIEAGDKEKTHVRSKKSRKRG